MFFDMLAVNFFTANTGFANGGALGVGNNPGGTTPVYPITQPRFTVANNQPVFGATPRPPTAPCRQSGLGAALCA